MDQYILNIQPCATSLPAWYNHNWAPFLLITIEAQKMRIALTYMGHEQPPTPAVTGSVKGDGFVNDNICQRRSRNINMIFYWVVYRVRQGKFMVYWVVGEHNIADYFTNHYPTSHHCSKQSTYLVPIADVSKYACYMYPYEHQGCVEAPPSQGNGQVTDKVSLL